MQERMQIIMERFIVHGDRYTGFDLTAHRR